MKDQGIGRAFFIIVLLITLPFLMLGLLLVQSAYNRHHHSVETHRTIALFESGLQLVPHLETLRDTSSAETLLSADKDLVSLNKEAYSHTNVALNEFTALFGPQQSDSLAHQKQELLNAWKTLRVSPGWSMETPNAAFENVSNVIKKLYQTLSGILYEQRNFSSADLYIQQNLRPILDILQEMRHEVGILRNTAVYVALREGNLSSMNAERIDRAWRELNDLFQNASTQFDALKTSLPEGYVTQIRLQLPQVKDYIERTHRDLIMADDIEQRWQDAFSSGGEALNAMHNIGLILIYNAEYINEQETDKQIWLHIFYGLALVALYLLAMGFTYFLSKSRNDALQAQQESLAKSQFLARMSHEIRTPLNGVLGLAELLRDTNPSEKQSEQIELIESAGRSLVMLINDILDYAKIEAGKMELEKANFNLHTMLYESLHMFSLRACENHSIVLAAIEEDVPVTLYTDEVRLRQVLINLVSNAIKFTEQGAIEVRVSRQLRSPHDRRLLFEVLDTGIGISEEDQAHLFEVFSQASSSITRRYGGTGLGLSISREVVKLLGGDIGARTNPEQPGALFWFNIPIELASQGKQEKTRHTICPNKGLLLDSTGHLARFITQHASLFPNIVCVATRQEAEYQLDNAGEIPFEIVVATTLDTHFDAPGATKLLAEHPHCPHVRLLTGIRENVFTEALDHYGLDSIISRSVFTLHHLYYLFQPEPDSLQHLQNSHQLSHTDILPSDLRVLIAEDNEVNQMVTIGFLKKLGIRYCDVAADGQQALDMYCEQKGNYDLVLMDLDMPEMDGYEATRQIRSREQRHGWKHTKILALSAHALPQHGAMATNAGMDGQLVKPVTLKTLFNVLNEQLH